MTNPESAARLAAIVESSHDAIVSKTLDGQITSWNASAERIFGYSPEEAIGQSILLIVPPDRQAEEHDVLRRIRAGQKVEHFETVRLAKSGQRVPVSLTVSAIRDGDGAIIGASKIARDISEQKKHEAERTALLESTQAASRARDDFLATLGHELRNPIAAIAGAADLIGLVEHLDDLDPRAVLKRQVDQRRLVDDLLDASRVRTGKVVLDRRTLDLAEAVERALDVLRAGAGSSMHEIETRCAHVGVYADPARVEQILLNLLSNAVKYTPAGRRIRVSVHEEGAQAVLRVEDEGVGIARENLSQIFGLFVQDKDNLNRANGGLGIGLSLVRTLTEMHGGTVDASSEGPGLGSTFTIRLPSVPLRARMESRAQPAATRRGHRILVVEDNDDAREMLCEYLRAYGHDVYEAADGAEGIRLAVQLCPDLALIDVGLPIFDGYEVARRIRQHPNQPKRLVALTGYGHPEARRQCLAAGFDDHLVKPLDISQLTALLEPRRT